MARVRFALAAVLVVSTLLAYIPAMRGGFVWDDDDYITENQTLRSLHGLSRIWFELGAVPQYYPMVHTTFWIEYQLWGARPFGFHLSNVLLHALNGLLLWELLRRLRIGGAWVAAALFLLHPMQVESVAWLTERKNVLSGMFYLLAALMYLGVGDRETGAGDRRRDRWRYACAFVFYLCALLSKSVTVTLPAAIAVILWLRDGRVRRRDLLRLGAMLPFGVAAGTLTSWMEKYNVGASGPEWALSVVQRCVVAGRAFWFYLGKLAWPHPLVFIYPRWKPESFSAAMLLVPVAVLLLVLALWILRGRLGRGPLAATLLYGGTLAPALGFVNIYPMRFSFVADHFAYLAVIGPLALAAASAASLREALRPAVRNIAAASGAAILVLLFALAWQRGYAYADEETLWRDTLSKNPDSFIANDNLGGILLLRGEIGPAEGLFETALRSRPEFPEALNNLGLVRQHQGRPDDAVALFRDALKWSPQFVDAQNNLGIVLAGQKKWDEAEGHFRDALRIRPSFANAHVNLALTLERVGRVAEAVAEYREALRLEPDLPSVQRKLAWVLATDPDPTVRNGAEAVRYGEAAAAAKGFRDAQTVGVLAAAYAEAGRFEDAIRTEEEAVALALASGGPEASERPRKALALYRAGRPYRRE